MALPSVTVFNQGTVALFSQPIGLKYSETKLKEALPPKYYHYSSYWLSCMNSCLQCKDLNIDKQVGYYACFDEEAFKPFDGTVDDVGISDTPNAKQICELSKIVTKIWVDLQNEAIEVAYNYGSEFAAHQETNDVQYHFGDIMAEARFGSNKALDAEFSLTCANIASLLGLEKTEEPTGSPKPISPERASHRD